MRQTFAKSTQETHASNEDLALKGYQFYAATDTRVYKGNHSGISANDADPIEDDVAVHMEQLFQTFELQLEGSKADELVDSETQEILEALGYAR
jgi:hypothetical protein